MRRVGGNEKGVKKKNPKKPKKKNTKKNTKQKTLLLLLSLQPSESRSGGPKRECGGAACVANVSLFWGAGDSDAFDAFEERFGIRVAKERGRKASADVIYDTYTGRSVLACFANENQSLRVKLDVPGDVRNAAEENNWKLIVTRNERRALSG
jgi:hypothetical protein